MELFLKDRFHPQLNFHALKGDYLNCFSINVNSDYRIIFHIKDDSVFLIKIGTHSQLYG